MTFVVDASLATKWLIEEDDSVPADEFFLQQFGRMHVPDLLLVELGSAIVKAVNSRRLSDIDGRANLDRLHLQVQPALLLYRITPELTLTAARMAIDLGHPIKDCIYLALADQLGIPLATCDVKFRDRVGDPARVRLLAEVV